MKGDPLPITDHISRFCRPQQCPGGQIQATAFFVRPDEPSLSVNWLEFLNCRNREHEITELRKIYASKLKVGATARIAILNVGIVIEKVHTESEDRRNIEILHDPLEGDPPDPSHSGIYNLKSDDELIAELILETVLDDYLARN